MIALTLWESPKFDAVTCQLTDNKLVNNTRGAIGSGMECLIGSKVAKTTATMKKFDINIDPGGDVASMNVSDKF